MEEPDYVSFQGLEGVQVMERVSSSRLVVWQVRLVTCGGSKGSDMNGELGSEVICSVVLPGLHLFLTLYSSNLLTI